jgi:hypothetical protein
MSYPSEAGTALLAWPARRTLTGCGRTPKSQLFPGWFATGAADPQGMKPFVVIASEAKQSQRDGATRSKIASSPAAPRYYNFCGGCFILGRPESVFLGVQIAQFSRQSRLVVCTMSGRLVLARYESVARGAGDFRSCL